MAIDVVGDKSKRIRDQQEQCCPFGITPEPIVDEHHGQEDEEIDPHRDEPLPERAVFHGL